MKPAIPLHEILESDWKRDVRKLATRLGYDLGYHTHDSRKSDTGFPDEVFVSTVRRRVVYLELKREAFDDQRRVTGNGKVTDRQKAWISALHRCGAEVYVVRPHHLDALATVLSTTHFDGQRYHEARGVLLLELEPILQEAA